MWLKRSAASLPKGSRSIGIRPDIFERGVALMTHRGRILVMAGLTAHPSFPVGAVYPRDCSMLGFAITNATTQELRGMRRDDQSPAQRFKVEKRVLQTIAFRHRKS
jgi:hypothetical protein